MRPLPPAPGGLSAFQAEALEAWSRQYPLLFMGIPAVPAVLSGAPVFVWIDRFYAHLASVADSLVCYHARRYELALSLRVSRARDARRLVSAVLRSRERISEYARLGYLVRTDAETRAYVRELAERRHREQVEQINAWRDAWTPPRRPATHTGRLVRYRHRLAPNAVFFVDHGPDDRPIVQPGGGIVRYRDARRRGPSDCSARLLEEFFERVSESACA